LSIIGRGDTGEGRGETATANTVLQDYIGGFESKING
jgi:hypothetical protein